MSGILLVLSEPGPAVTDAEFNDWYDNEHVPLRIPIPAFQSWSRWVAADGKKPSYIALYDLTSPDAVSQPPYASLADTRSAREKDILARLALLDRRTYAAVPVATPPCPGYDPAKPGPVLSFFAADVPDEHVPEFDRWYEEEHVPLFANIPGWVRTTRFVLRDAGASGSDESLRPEGGRPQRFLALHEWTSERVLEDDAFKAAIATPWAQKMFANASRVDARLFKLVRTWTRE